LAGRRGTSGLLMAAVLARKRSQHKWQIWGKQGRPDTWGQVRERRLPCRPCGDAGLQVVGDAGRVRGFDPLGKENGFRFSVLLFSKGSEKELIRRNS
jgi:hypothetical protein